MDKPAIFTKHALERLIERAITQEEAVEALQKGKRVGWSQEKILYEWNNVLVVYEELADVVKVITVYRPNRTLEERIDKLPMPNEWWKTSSREAFIAQGYFLMEKGLNIEEVMQHFFTVYRAVCAEYGE